MSDLDSSAMPGTGEDTAFLEEWDGGRHRAPTSVVRRSTIGAGAAALLGAGAVGVHGLLGGPERQTAAGAPAPARRPPGGTPSPSTTADSTSTSAPQPSPDPTTSAPPAGPGAGTPADGATTPDRDASYSSLTDPVPGDDAPEVGRRRAGRLALPVADTPASRAHVVRRAGLSSGAPAVAAVKAAGLDGWLAEQLDPSLDDPAGDHVASLFPLAGAPIATVRARVKEFSWDAMYQTGYASLGRQMFSAREVYEAVVDVFHNLLQVTIPSDGLWASGPDYEERVIRRHAFGSFTDMLLASARHPAMLVYLDNRSSTKAHVNENYGRELLELHTLGVASGYSESDVVDCARVMSGRRITGQHEFVYEPEHHATGAVSVLGWSSANSSAGGGLAVGDDLLTYLARHPATARTVARRLAVRFVSDTPSDRLLDVLSQSYLDAGTQILPVLETLFGDEEFWSSTGTKGRRPVEDLAGVVRALGVDGRTVTAGAVRDMYWQMRDLGHAPLAWPAPNGYPDVAAAWASASSMVARWNLHRRLVRGWVDGMAPRKALAADLAPADGATNAEWVAAVTTLLTGRAPTASTTAGLLAYLDAAADAPAEDPRGTTAPELARLVFDSPSYLIR
ncbi:DUF1800 family protein [Phycicoccus sp. CSK15P-2]|uniref:DUF1800 domain-containing protein n=1 Tax=Phycicoccus sp. CSK15P-2 TaxID=2807627 RepID=UPI00194F87F6|nr:DUF1800 domain-containing protein [Phycicoccus sp. CSK15P-2]MBM6404684.1 DUF1800 family protein [Phycicoccus sp. CSK15P-2]